MTDKTRVGLIFGGNSSEYEIPIVSGHNIYNAIDKEEYDVYPIWLTKGNYFVSLGDSKKVWDGPIYTIKNPHKLTNVSDFEQLVNLSEMDVYFPIIHGNIDEDGVIQGFFRILDKPFAGDDVLATTVTMNKEFIKVLAQRAGVPVADWVIIERFEYNDENNSKFDYSYVSKKLGTDLFVKPSNQGSSAGISHVKPEAGYLPVLVEAFKYDDKVLVEKTIGGTEVEIAVLGNDDIIVPGVGQVINAKGSFYSYENRYDDSSTATLQIPAGLPVEIVEKVRSDAEKIYHVTGCGGMARIDSTLRTNDHEVILNESNALPGFTNISTYPRLSEEAGTKHTDLISRLIELTVERHNRKKTLLHKPE